MHACVCKFEILGKIAARKAARIPITELILDLEIPPLIFDVLHPDLVAVIKNLRAPRLKTWPR